MRQKQLEMLLQKLPRHPTPSPRLEQYSTPADIAADMLYLAHSQNDIEGKRVVELGCGTGIFSIGAKLLGADSVIGVDIDPKAVEIAKNYSEELGLDIEFKVADVSDYTTECDTVLQNPPFGAQRKGADRKFLEKALELANVTYSLHLAKTHEFVRLLVEKLGGRIDITRDYEFPIKHMFEFHQEEKVEYTITLFRMVRL